MSGREAVPTWQPMAESIAVVVLLAAGLSALFLTLPNPGVFDPTMLFRAGAMSVDTALTEPWRLLACTWLHADWSHLVGNVVMMLLMSVLLTRALGWDRYLLLYLGSGLAGSLVSAAFEHPDLAVGASGAVFGLTGATTAYAIRPRTVLHELEVHTVREALLPIVGMQLLFSFLPGISWGAHLGGFGLGFALAFSGVLDLGLPERSTGSRMPPVRWSWVLASTLGVMGLGCCGNGLLTLVLLAIYVVGLVASGQSGPDWRPRLYPGVMLSALGLLGLNGMAVGMALWMGQPWDLDQPERRSDRPELPASVEVALPGGLGTVSIPEGLAEARVEAEEAGASVVRFGTRQRFPFALRLEVAEREAPEAVVKRLAQTPVDGRPREFSKGTWSERCPWIGWATQRDAGIVVFTAEAVVNVQLERWAEPTDPSWAAAEDALVEQLYALKDCGPSGWTRREVALALAAAELETDAMWLIDHQLQETPQDHGLRLLRAELTLRAGTCQAALLEFDRLSRVLRDESRVWSGLARATLECGPSRESLLGAEAAAERAVSLDAENAVAWEVLGDIRVALGMRESAEVAMRRAAALVPEGEERDRLLDRAAKARRGFRVRDRVGD